MIRSAVRKAGGGVEIVDHLARENLLWVDLEAPEPDEREAVEKALGVPVPARVRMRSLEPSSALVASDTHITMTFTGLGTIAEEINAQVTIVITPECVVTVHPASGAPFDAVRRFVETNDNIMPNDVVIVLVEATIDEISDRLEEIAGALDHVARDIFPAESAAHRSKRRANALMNDLGVAGMRLMRLQESLVSLERLGLFIAQHPTRLTPHLDDSAAAAALRDDVRALAQHTEALDDKVGFLLDAMLGIITLDQNQVMTVLSLTAAMFLPATLISSIFGMNFLDMPGLSWHHGFLICLGAMAVASAVVWSIFKWRRWL